jgi:hypothetical protein
VWNKNGTYGKAETQMPLARSTAGPHGRAGDGERLSNAMFAALAVSTSLWQGIDGNVTMNGPLIAVDALILAERTEI